MTPSVGRIVHYVSYGTPGGEYTSQCRAAVVAGVPAGALPPLTDSEHVQEWGGDAVVLDLVVLNPTGLFFNRCAYHGGDPDHVDATPGRPTYRGGTWHWPERVDA